MTTPGRRATRSRSSAAARMLSLTGVVVLGVALALPGSPASASVVAKVELGTADQFGVLAGSAVTNTGPTVVGSTDDTVGLSRAYVELAIVHETIADDARVNAAADAALKVDQDMGVAQLRGIGRGAVQYWLKAPRTGAPARPAQARCNGTRIASRT